MDLVHGLPPSSFLRNIQLNIKDFIEQHLSHAYLLIAEHIIGSYFFAYDFFFYVYLISGHSSNVGDVIYYKYAFNLAHFSVLLDDTVIVVFVTTNSINNPTLNAKRFEILADIVANII